MNQGFIHFSDYFAEFSFGQISHQQHKGLRPDIVLDDIFFIVLLTISVNSNIFVMPASAVFVKCHALAPWSVCGICIECNLC